jgi:hypothetical protein
MMAPTYSWICQRCRASNAAGADACVACMFPAVIGARRIGEGNPMTALLSPAAPDDAHWIWQESALLLPELLLAAVIALASPLWFVVLLRHGHYGAAAVLFIGIAPAIVLARLAFREKLAGGLYLTSWVVFVTTAIVALASALSH